MVKANAVVIVLTYYAMWLQIESFFNFNALLAIQLHCFLVFRVLTQYTSIALSFDFVLFRDFLDFANFNTLTNL